MIPNPTTVEVIARFIAGVHSHSLPPFYSMSSVDPFYDSLPDSSPAADEVDKKFFRSLAVSFLAEITSSGGTPNIRSKTA